MHGSPSSYLRTSNVSHGESKHNSPPSKLKTYGFIIAIIVGIGALAVGGAGVAGYFHVGTLSNLAQIDAIIMMAVGGGVGVILLIVGIVGTVKNRKTDRRSEISSQNQGVHSTSNNRNQRNRGTSGVRQTEFIDRTSTGTIRGAQYFGKTQWEAYFGDVGDEPPLPGNIHKILNSPCPFSGDESTKVKDTHMLVLVPATVNGEDLTLDKLEQLIQNPQKGNKTNYLWYAGSSLKDEHGSAKVGRSHWVLMTRDVLPGSKDKTYNDQKNLVKQYADQGYVVPDVIEAVACILGEFVASGECLFGREPVVTYTRCAQTVKGDDVVAKHPAAVGGFDSLGLSICCHKFDLEIDGVAALRRL